MKHILHKACLAMLLFVVGVCSGWAEDFTAKATLIDLWDCSKAVGSYNSDYSGVQFGSGTTAHGTFTLTSKSSYSNVKSVTIKASTGGSASITSVTVGGTTLTAPSSTTIASGTAKKNQSFVFTGNGTKSGNIVITFSATSKAMYVGAIDIEEGENGGDSGDNGDTPTPTPSANTGYFVKIASAADIVDGGQYIIVREDTETQYAAGINEGSANYLSINEFATTGYYYGEVNKSGKPYVYTLTADANNAGYYFLTNGDKYLNAASSGTNLTLGSKSTYSDWSIEVTSQKNVNIANKSAVSGGTGRLIKYNTGSPARFAAYASSTGSIVTLYRYVPSVAVSSAGYATYYNEFAYVMPEGLEGKIMEENSKTGSIVANSLFLEGEVVPANTALLLKGNEDVYPLIVATEEPDEFLVEYAEEFNLLHGRLTEGTTEGEGKHYKFTLDEDGLGWYYGAEDGAPFTIAANKAYLVVPNSALSTRFISIDDTTTAINGINTDANCGNIYDLTGRRISGTAKGLYIINGKKVIF